MSGWPRFESRPLSNFLTFSFQLSTFQPARQSTYERLKTQKRKWAKTQIRKKETKSKMTWLKRGRKRSGIWKKLIRIYKYCKRIKETIVKDGPKKRGLIIWLIQYDQLGTLSITNLRWPTEVKCHNMNELNLKWLLNNVVGLDRSSSPARFARTGSVTCSASMSPTRFPCSQGFIEYYTNG